MAYLHQPGWTMPTGRQVKSARTAIDEESLELFKSIVAEKAAFYERHYVAELGRKFADETKAIRTLESPRNAWRRRRFMRATRGQR